MTTIVDSLAHTWPPFVLVVGLLLIGHGAAREGLFGWIGHWCARLAGPDVTVFVVVMVACALVTATLNLDTAVVFMTPVAIETARRRGTDEVIFAYASVMMANAASTLLLGSNLTNLLVAAPEGLSGGSFTRALVLPWVVSVIATTAVAILWRPRGLRGRHRLEPQERVGLRVGPGVVATFLALVSVLLLPQPALVVLVLGLGVQALESLRESRVRWSQILAVANPTLLLPLFGLAVAVGWLGRVWLGPAHWLDHASVVETVGATAVGSVLINNLPAASLLAGHHVAHPLAAILGLDLGPNLFVTGALSSLLWWRIVTAHGVRPSLTRLTTLGVMTGVVTLSLTTWMVS
ncbi:MAG: hypothetical protein HKL87_00765 [Acidimicrobiaceae bacterium]|nr:hypothetical protein [Acidimicrobiaceae bacterium]